MRQPFLFLMWNINYFDKAEGKFLKKYEARDKFVKSYVE